MSAEGSVGTWSHCGNRRPHGAHHHTIVMNEGPYPDIPCLGTPEPEKPKRISHTHGLDPSCEEHLTGSCVIEEIHNLHDADGYRYFGRLPGHPKPNPEGEAYCTHCQYTAPCPTRVLTSRALGLS